MAQALTIGNSYLPAAPGAPEPDDSIRGVSTAGWAIIALFFGQRMTKDYAGAAVLVPYFLLTLVAMYLLAQQ